MCKWYRDWGLMVMLAFIIFITVGQFFAHVHIKSDRIQAEKDLSAGIGGFVSLKMEYAYKQGQVDALHGLVKVRIYTNDANKEVWEWIGTPWDGDLKPHSPALVDAQNDADIVDKLRAEQ